MAEIKELKLQSNFFDRIRAIAGQNESLVFVLSELLGLSTDSIYRRLRGETPLSIDEIALLCRHYNISFDVFSSSTTGRVEFNYSVPKTLNEFKQNWLGLLSILKDIYSSKDAKITYASVDIPLPHNFAYPQLTAFKLFYWCKEVLGCQELKDAAFDPDWLPEEYLTTCHEIHELYAQIPSVEIWTESTANCLLKQIEYYVDTEQFASKQIAMQIIDDSIAMISGIITKAANNSKIETSEITDSEKQNFKFYQCDIELGNNSVYVSRDGKQEVYMGLLTYNIMKTSNTEFCQETQTWLNGIIKKSTLISGIAQKQRHLFYKKLISGFDNLKLRMG